MEYNEELKSEDFAFILFIMALFPTEELKEMLRKYVEKEKPTEV